MMKSTLHTIISLALLVSVTLMSSCQKDPVTEPEQELEKHYIRFNVSSVDSHTTKATIIDGMEDFEGYYGETGFGVFVKDNSYVPFSGVHDEPFYGRNVRFVLKDSTGVWLPDEEIEWPSTGTDFYCYAPYNPDWVIDEDGKFHYTTPADNAGHLDLMVASQIGVDPNHNRPVDLEFHYALTGIAFVTGNIETAGVFKKISFKGIYGEADYSFLPAPPETSAAGWLNHSNTTGTYSLNHLGEDGNGFAVNTDMLPNIPITTTDDIFFFIPQTLSPDAVMEIEFNDGIADQTLTANLAELTVKDSEDLCNVWEQGYLYTYYVSISSTEISINPVITPYNYTGNRYFVTD